MIKKKLFNDTIVIRDNKKINNYYDNCNANTCNMKNDPDIDSLFSVQIK